MAEKKKELNLKQKAFCELYTSKSEFFANGTQSYIEAYNIDVSKPGAYASARTKAYQLLTNGDILKHIDSLLDLRGLNDQFVDKQLEFVITQNADLKVKVSAIKEYNNLKKRITSKLEVSGADGKPLIPEDRYANLSAEDRSALLAILNKSIASG